MRLPFQLAAFAICCVVFTLPAAAQLDSSALRAKYGLPLNRETFHMPAGFDVIVDYGSSHQVCKLELPALMPTKDEVQNADVMKQQMYTFLGELVPPAMRGLQLRQLVSQMSLTSLWQVDYEHVNVSELRHADNPFDGKISVAFKNDNCPKPAAQ